MLKTLLFGAGAIGRGFLAPILSKAGFQIDFVENDENIIKKFHGKKCYTTAITAHSGYHLTTVNYRNVYYLDELKNTEDYDIVFISVGTRNCLKLVDFIAYPQTVFILENDWHKYEIFRNTSSNRKVFFGIPDVITSNFSPPELVRIDPLCVVSEIGQLLLENGEHNLNFGRQDVKLLNQNDLNKHWNCKFFIHNASHAVVAYLGAICGCTYIHQAMAHHRIGPIVINAMEVITKSLIMAGIVDEKQATEYMARECKRFQNPLLYDPIIRVARDPFRKLHYNDRLIKALRIAMNAHLDTFPFLLAIRAAMEYRGINKDDIRFTEYRQLNSPRDILRKICRIHDEILIQRIIEIDLYNCLIN